MSEALLNDGRAPADDPAVLGHVTVRPGRMERLEAGTFEPGNVPAVALAFEPHEPDGVVCTPTVVARDGREVLVYHCQNFGNLTCRVTARRAH